MKNYSLNRNKPIRKVSDKQKKELALRRKLKRELIAEFGEHCMSCGSTGDFRGLHLSHKRKHLSLGGKTTREDCIIECAPCHFGPGGHNHHEVRSEPKWSTGQ